MAAGAESRLAASECSGEEFRVQSTYMGRLSYKQSVLYGLAVEELETNDPIGWVDLSPMNLSLSHLRTANFKSLH